MSRKCGERAGGHGEGPEAGESNKKKAGRRKIMESRVCDQIAKAIVLVKVTAKQKIGDINSDPIPPIG